MIPPNLLIEKIETIFYAGLAFFMAFVQDVSPKLPGLDYRGELLKWFFSIAAAVSSYLIIDIIKRYKAKRAILKRKKDEANRE